MEPSKIDGRPMEKVLKYIYNICVELKPACSLPRLSDRPAESIVPCTLLLTEVDSEGRDSEGFTLLQADRKWDYNDF